MYVDINAAGCSDTCRHCAVDGHFPLGDFFSLDELRSTRQEWGALTIRYEPTAHSNFPEIYHPDIASDHGGWLVTNGFGLANRSDYLSIFEKMQVMGIKTIAFTLHGLEKHHDWFVCRPGAYHDILLATQRVKEFGFKINWQVYVDKIGVADLATLVDVALKATGEFPSLTIPYHRVGGRLLHFERIRLSIFDVEKYQLPKLIDDPEKNSLIQPEILTSSAWLQKWIEAPDSDEFKHPYEPRLWPPDPTYEMLSLRIEHNRKVFLDPMCSSPIYLGNLSEGRNAIVEKIGKLSHPPYSDISPRDIALSGDEQEQLHPSGFSLRYKEITRKRLSKTPS